MIIYAGTSGGLDKVPTTSVQEFEREFLQYMRDTKPEIAQGILDTEELSDEAKAVLDECLVAVAAQMGISEDASESDAPAASEEEVEA